MRGRVIVLVFFAVAAAAMVGAQLTPLGGAKAHVKEYDGSGFQDVPVLDVTLFAWWMSDSIGDRDGAYIGWTPPPPDPDFGDRGDLAPWLGPTALVLTAVAATGAALSRRARWPLLLGTALVLAAGALVGLGLLIDDLNGLGPRLAAEARQAHAASAGGSAGGGFQAAPSPGFAFVVVADLAAIGAVVSSILLTRQPTPADGAMPTLPDQHDS